MMKRERLTVVSRFRLHGASCPCHHPNPSNQRWCCGGENSGSRHFDLSYAAFDAIAIRHRGVVDIKYRKTSCDTLGQEKYYS